MTDSPEIEITPEMLSVGGKLVECYCFTDDGDPTDEAGDHLIDEMVDEMMAGRPQMEIIAEKIYCAMYRIRDSR